MSDIQTVVSEIIKKGHLGDLEDISELDALEFVKELMKQQRAKYGPKQIYKAAGSIRIHGKENVENVDIFFDKIDEAREQLKGIQFEELWRYFKFTLNYGLMGGDSWQPRVLLNGAVLIRNYHRVISLCSNPSHILAVNKNTLLSEVQKMAELLGPKEKPEEVFFNFSLLHRTEEGVTWGNKLPKDFSSHGETLIFLPTSWLKEISENKILGTSSVLNDPKLLEIASSSRSGHCVLRTYEERTYCFMTQRDSDELDTVCEEFSDTPEWDSEPVDVGYRGYTSIMKEIEDRIENIGMELNITRRSTVVSLLITYGFNKDYGLYTYNLMTEVPAIFGPSCGVPAPYTDEGTLGSRFQNAYSGRLLTLTIRNLPVTEIKGISNAIIPILKENLYDLGVKSIKGAFVDHPRDVWHLDDEEVFDIDHTEFQSSLLTLEEKMLEEYDGEMEVSEYLEYSLRELFLVVELDHSVDPSEMDQIGKDLSEKFKSITVTLPAYGIHQSYDNGDEDTGNVMSFKVI